MIQRKITVIAPDFKPMLGGVAEYSFQLAEKLNQSGILDFVITPNIQVESCNFNFAAPKKIEWIQDFKNRGLIKSKIYSLLYLSQLRWLEVSQAWHWLFHRDQVFIIVTWLISPLSKRWLFILNFLQIPYAIVLHGKDIIIASQFDTDWFEKTCAKAQLIIFNSQATATLFQEYQPNLKVADYILYPSVDLNYFQGATLYSVADLAKVFNCNLSNKLIISSVCRLVKRKGIDLAIAAIAPILKTNQDLIYIIMGIGEEYQSIQAKISSLNLDDRVKLVGDLNDDYKFSLLSASSIFIMPNICLDGNDFEGFGISFLEASFFENVTIGGRNGGVVEAIKDGHSGFLVDADSAGGLDAIREIITSLLSHPDRISEMAEFGHEYVVDNFQSTVTVNAFDRYIRENFLSK
jgi:phosphatidyl-myo-inositol dimannoside synthase